MKLGLNDQRAYTLARRLPVECIPATDLRVGDFLFEDGRVIEVFGVGKGKWGVKWTDVHRNGSSIPADKTAVILKRGLVEADPWDDDNEEEP